MKKIGIVSITSNYAIGYKNNLIYRIPSELKHFKNTTTSHLVLMGRKTFNSLGNKPLPNRMNCVLSKNYKYLESKLSVQATRRQRQRCHPHGA